MATTQVYVYEEVKSKAGETNDVGGVRGHSFSLVLLVSAALLSFI